MKRMSFLHCKCLIALLVALGSVSTSVRAEYIEPSTIQLKTERHVPEVNDFEFARYEYEMSWQGIPVGAATVEVSKPFNSAASKENMLVTARAKTTKFIDVFYKLRHKSEALMKEGTLEPVKFSSFQTENSKTKSARIDFESGRIKSVLEKNGKLKMQHDFSTGNLTLDPITAAFMAKSIPISVGRVAEFDIFNGKHRYLISFEVLGKEKLKVAGVEREAFKVRPSIKKLTDSEGEDRFKGATLWLAADESRDVLKLESEVLVGSVGAVLKRIHRDFNVAENPSEFDTDTSDDNAVSLASR